MALNFTAEVVHELPDVLSTLIGRTIVAYARLEYNLTNLSAVILGLQKPEARVALATPRAIDRFDTAVDLLALRDIYLNCDIEEIRGTITTATSERDLLAHGIWLRHPQTSELYLRRARGTWPKEGPGKPKIKREIFPQSIPYGEAECKKALSCVQAAIDAVNGFGTALDQARETFPDRFRLPSPLLNPLGSRTHKDSQHPHPKRSEAKGKKK